MGCKGCKKKNIEETVTIEWRLIIGFIFVIVFFVYGLVNFYFDILSFFS